MMEKLYMSGYWPYVWSSYALGIGALLLNAWWARRNLSDAKREALRRIATSNTP
jgi:heme exporter protein CcmD